MKILLAVDGSIYTQKMLAYLSAHSALFSTTNEYTVFTAHSPLPPRVRSAVGNEIVNGYYAEEVDKVLDPVCKFLLQHDIHPQRDWKVGPVGETISKFADAGKFDLIVMGSHGHGALGNLVMGSITTQVLAHSSIPVLLVR